MVEATRDADVLIFVVPHQFVSRICQTLHGKVKPGASAISLIKVTEHTVLSYNHFISLKLLNQQYSTVQNEKGVSIKSLKLS